jgi:general secretion pathway protein L
MNVINIKYRLRMLKQNAIYWPWAYDAFVELASKQQTEIAITKGNFSLYRGSNLNRHLNNQTATVSATSLAPVMQHIKSGDRVLVSIAEDMCFAHQLRVPVVAMKKIGAILDFELAKTTPFVKEQVYTGWKSKVSDSVPGVCNVTHYVIRRDYLTECITALSSKGAKFNALVVRQSDGSCLPFALTARGEDYAKKLAVWWTKATIVSATALALCILSFIGTFQWHYARVSTFIEDSADVFTSDAAMVRKHIDSLNAYNAEQGALLARRSSAVANSTIIEELSKILKDDSYLDGLNISGNIVTIDGSANNPEELIALLEASPFFKAVTFNTPSFRNPGELKSRFSIRLSVAADGA